MKKYTEAIHRERLKKMLKKKNPCGLCPGAPRFKCGKGVLREYVFNPNHRDNQICKVCKDFVGMKEKRSCPCLMLGEEEAIKRTVIALEKRR